MRKRAGLAILALFAALGIAEIYLRFYPPVVFARFTDMGISLFEPDPILKFQARPNFRYALMSESGKPYLVETNAYGLRDDPYHGKKGRRTIIGLGDSYTFGDGIDKGNRYLDLLGRRIDREFPGVFRVINAGTPGWVVNQQFLYYLHRGELIFDPDYILVFCYINNFFSGADKSNLQVYRGIPLRNRHWPGEIHPDTAPSNTLIEHSRSNLRLFDFISFCKKMYAQRRETTTMPTEAVPHVYIDSQLYLSVVLEAGGHVQMYGDFLMKLKTWAEAEGRKLIFIHVPSAAEVEDGIARQRHYIQYTRVPRDKWDWEGASKRIRSMVDGLGIPFLSPMDAFKNNWQATGRSLYLCGWGHLNTEGNRLLAETIWPGLLEIIKRDDQKVASRPRNMFQVGPHEFNYPVPSAGDPYFLELMVYPDSDPFVFQLYDGTRILHDAPVTPHPAGPTIPQFKFSTTSAAVRASLKPLAPNGRIHVLWARELQRVL